MSTAAERSWRPGFVVDLPTVLRPLSRGRGDPTLSTDGGRFWRASNTPDGPVTLALSRTPDGVVNAVAWGAGAEIGRAHV